MVRATIVVASVVAVLIAAGVSLLVVVASGADSSSPPARPCQYLVAKKRAIYGVEVTTITRVCHLPR